jgi:hypothetical protein
VTFQLVLAFDSEQPEFARGFEAGVIWGRMLSDTDPFEHTIHDRNCEMAIRMAEARHRSFVATDCEGHPGWVTMHYGGEGGDDD